MTRFYIDTDDGPSRRLDRIGIDLPDKNAAREVVLETLPDLARAGLPDEHDYAVVKAVARDPEGPTVYRASMTRSGTWQ